MCERADLSRSRELRLRLPEEKWNLLEKWRGRGVGSTYADLIILALECLHDKLVERDLQETRLIQLQAAPP